MHRSPILRAVLLAGVAMTAPALAHEEEAARNELFKPGVEHAGAAPATTGDRPPLIDGLGAYGMTVVASPEAQAYFDQGLGWLWGFNHAEAVRAFRAAQEIDPTCAMCFWGEAYALGPNLNMPMQPDQAAPAWAALQEAVALGGKTPKERALIGALAERYAPGGGDRAALDRAFADAMAAVAAEWPDDANVQALLADALMNLQPWDYWEADGVTPKGNGGRILAALEAALAAAPDHPAALHLYIHATEASSSPERAEAAADRLAASVSAAGHLVHMPAHVYNRVGRFEDSIAANQAAIAADEAFLAAAGDAASPLYRYGYYPHNVHFLLVAAQNAGLGDVALEAADKLAGVTSDEMASRLAWVQAISTAPYSAHAQFSDAETILALEKPRDAFPFVQGYFHYARGLGLAREGRGREARAEAEAIGRLIEAADLSLLEDQHLPARSVLGIAQRVVEGRIAAAEGDFDAARRHLGEAIALEETIAYMEPPYWYYPVHQTLGAVELQAGRPAEAAAAFGTALEQSPNNGWALWGLWEARKALAGDGATEGEAAGLEDLAARAAGAWLGDSALLTLSRL